MQKYRAYQIVVPCLLRTFKNTYKLCYSLKALKSLHNLDLRSNSFSKGLPEVVTQLTTLTSLTLRNCRLTKLPDR